MFDTSERGAAVVETIRRVQAGEPTLAPELVAVFRWVEEQKALLEAARLAVVNQLAYRPPGILDDDQPQPQRHEAVPGVLAAELGWGKARARSYDNLAYRLCEELTATHQALQTGLIDEPVAHAISDGLVCLDRTRQLELEAAVLAWIRRTHERDNRRVNAARVRAWLEREVISTDPDAADQRHAEKTRRRDVQLVPDIDSAADLHIYNLPADQARIVYDYIDGLAHDAKRAGDERRLGQLRADIAVELLSGHNFCRADTDASGSGSAPGPGEPTEPAQPTEPVASGHPTALGQPAAASAGPGEPDSDECSRPAGRGHPSSLGRAKYVLYVSLAELLQLRTEPGELGGYGPVIRDVAQRLVAMGIDNPDADYDLAVTNSRGQVIQLHGINRRLFTGKLRDLVNATWRRCTFPSGCHRPAESCQIDHSTDYASGGLTTLSNANPICESEHPDKTENGWTQYRPDPATGEIIWRSPYGQTYRAQPEPLAEPPPGEPDDKPDGKEGADDQPPY